MKTKGLLLPLLILTLLSGCSSSPKTSKEVQKKLEIYPLCLNKLTVAVDQFKTEDITLEAWTEDVATNSREVAVNELVNSKCYKVLEREERSLLGSGIQNEKALARSDEAKKSKVAEKNQVYSADYLLTYAITALKKGGEGFHLGWLTAIAGAIIGGKEGNALAGLDVAFSNDHVYLTCRITDTASSEILASSQVKVKDSNVSFGFDGGALSGKGGGLGGIEFFKQSKVGKMVASAVQKCSIQLSHELFKKGLLYETAPVESKPLLETKPSTKPHLSKKTSSRKKVKSNVKPSKQIVKGRN